MPNKRPTTAFRWKVLFFAPENPARILPQHEGRIVARAYEDHVDSLCLRDLPRIALIQESIQKHGYLVDRGYALNGLHALKIAASHLLADNPGYWFRNDQTATAYMSMTRWNGEFYKNAFKYRYNSHKGRWLTHDSAVKVDTRLAAANRKFNRAAGLA